MKRTVSASPRQDKDDVSASFNLLVESLNEEDKRIRKEGSKAMDGGDYDTATAVIDFAKRLTSSRAKADALGKEWGDLEDVRGKATPAVQQFVSKRFFGRRKSDEITSQDDYCIHILRTLVEMGGAGKTKDVIVKVVEKMKSILKLKDYEKTATRVKELRWENNTRWARQRMVVDGRMDGDSKTGIWEISDKGHAWLKKQ